MDTDRPPLNPFSEEVEAILRKAGWFPGRKVHYVIPATWAGRLPVHDCAIQVLEEFGGLLFRCKNPWKKRSFPLSLFMSEYRDPQCPDAVSTVCVKGSNYTSNQSEIDFYRTSIGGNWVSVAELDGNDPVFMDERGRVINYNEYWASSWTSFLERILTGKLREEPPDDLKPGYWPEIPADSFS